jgi:hypothetical protein
VTVSDTANLTQEVSINQKKKIVTHTDSSRIVTLYVVFPDSQRLGTTTHCVRLRDCVLAGETGGEPGKYPRTLELEPLFLLLPAMQGNLLLGKCSDDLLSDCAEYLCTALSSSLGEDLLKRFTNITYVKYATLFSPSCLSGFSIPLLYKELACVSLGFFEIPTASETLLYGLLETIKRLPIIAKWFFGSSEDKILLYRAVSSSLIFLIVVLSTSLANFATSLSEIYR